MTPKPTLKSSLLKLRKWQAGALDDYLEKQKKDYLLMVTPGGGKTIWALVVAKNLLEQGAIDKVVLVCHSLIIRDQWRKVAWERFGLCLVGIDEPNRSFSGLLTTYQQVAQKASRFQDYCSAERCLVIFDEVHHAAEKKSWGDQAAIAFTSAVRLSLSGTPFRSDGNPITFVSYRDSVCVPDFVYTYGESVKDRVCRRLHFPTFDGRASWSKDGLFTKELAISEVTQSDRASLVSTILDPSHNFVRSMLKHADEHLTHLRSDGCNAAGIVMAKNIDHADSLAKVIEEITGHIPVVVHKENSGAAISIDKFVDSEDRWIVSVRMVSEGVDIPRLRVLCYLTNYMTDMFFWQAVGRVSRGDGDAWVYLPDLPELKKMARDIYASQIPESGSTSRSDEPISMVEREPSSVATPSRIETISAEGSLSGVISASNESSRLQTVVKDDWDTFFASWHSHFGESKVSVTDLFDANLDLPQHILSCATLKSQLTTLGRCLQDQINKDRLGLRLVHAGATRGRKLYSLLQKVNRDSSHGMNSIQIAMALWDFLQEKLSGQNAVAVTRISRMAPASFKDPDCIKACLKTLESRGYIKIKRKPVGSIIKRGEQSYLIRIFLGRDPTTGKRRYLTETHRGSKEEAEIKLKNMNCSDSLPILGEDLVELSPSAILQSRSVDPVVRDSEAILTGLSSAPGGLTITEISRRLFNSSKPSKEIIEALEVLERKGLAAALKQFEGAGRIRWVATPVESNRWSNHSERTKAGLKAKKESGATLGAKPLADQGTLARIRQLRKSGMSMAGIAQDLEEQGFRTQRGGNWHACTIKKILDREQMAANG